MKLLRQAVKTSHTAPIFHSYSLVKASWYTQFYFQFSTKLCVYIVVVWSNRNETKRRSCKTMRSVTHKYENLHKVWTSVVVVVDLPRLLLWPPRPELKLKEISYFHRLIPEGGGSISCWVCWTAEEMGGVMWRAVTARTDIYNRRVYPRLVWVEASAETASQLT